MWVGWWWWCVVVCKPNLGVLWDTLYLMFFFSLLTASVRSRPYGPTLDIFMNQNKHNWQLLIHTVFFLLTRALLFTHAHIGGPSKLISGIPPYFDQTRRNMKKIRINCSNLWVFLWHFMASIWSRLPWPFHLLNMSTNFLSTNHVLGDFFLLSVNLSWKLPLNFLMQVLVEWGLV